MVSPTTGLSETGCYFSFPYYFPLSGIIGKPDGRSSVYATSITSDTTGELTRIAAPLIPPAERLVLDHIGTNSTASSSEGGRHRLSLRISGSAQMVLVSK